MNEILSRPIEDIVTGAWALRSEFDLSKVGYGRIHWGNLRDFLKAPFSYYYFLAGLVKLTRAQKILEIGTHQGGSTRALRAGLISPQDSKIVTFDVTPDGREAFAKDSVVKAFTVDGNSREALEICLREFDGPNIDLAYIDSTHDFWTTLQSFTLYTTALKCPLVVLDDITLNPDMVRLWSLIRNRHGAENTIDAVDVDREIRTGGGGTRPGFGIVRIT